MNRPTTKPTITVALLRNYFSVVKELRTYLSEILEPLLCEDSSIPYLRYGFKPKDTDTHLYWSLVETSYVAFNADTPGLPGPSFKVFSAMADMREVLDKAQERIFRGKNAQNIITAGYRRAFKDGDRGKTGMTRVGITNHFVNTMVTALQSPEWDVLLQRIGIDPMLHLLTETSIFVSLPNGCLCQVTGEPIIYSVPKFRQVLEPVQIEQSRTLLAGDKRPFPFNDDRQQRAAKRRKPDPSIRMIQPPGPKRPAKNLLPMDISVSRARLFYSRPKLLSQSNQIIAGLPEKHILNQIHSSYRRPPKIEPGQYAEPDPKEQERHTRHLSKYVFPRQYGLNSPFTETNSKRHVFGFPDYTDRELEIKTKGSCKTPKRLKEILLLLETMIWRHGKCGYKPLRDKVCPSKLQSTDGKRLDSSIILECISEQSVLLTQAPLRAGNTSVDSYGNSILPVGSTQAERHAKSKPRFADFACPTVEVYRYVALVTKTVIPKGFWGNEANFKVILRYVKEFIQCRRFESLTLHHIIQGFSTSACDWLIPPGTGAREQSRVSVSDALKRRELLEEFIFWYFDSFVSSLLKTNFYITETSAFRNRVLYFRHDDWAAMCAPLIDRLANSTFMKMTDSEAKEVLRQRKLGFSFVRLLPKETGVRPIVNLRRRKPIQGRGQASEQSINQILQAAFQILSYEKQKEPHRLGASVFSPDDVYSKLKDFKSRLSPQPDGKLPRLYFVKVDVQACFDTIEQTRLLEILRELISEVDRYMTQRYGQVQMAAGRIKRTFVKKAVPEDDHPHFLTYAAQLAGALRHTIFVDQVVYPYSQKREILSLLEEHITENIVKIGPHYYRQTVGIPQGSILSALLCSFFYGDLEKRFTSFRSDLGSVLLRLIDDYLFITTSRARAIHFIEMMEKGHPEYGCFISKEKTLTNFDHDIQISNVTEPKQQSFPWCGYMINMTDLSVSVDYSRYLGTSLRDTLTVDRGRHPGASFTQKMLWLARTKCHPIYSDSALNPEDVIYLNIYQNFLLCAMKMHGYICEWGIKSNKNPAFIYNTIQNMINVSYSTLRNRTVHKARLGATAPLSGIQKLAVKWLGTHAFCVVLKKKPARHVSLLRSLSFELSRPRSRRYKKQFSRLTREGLAGLGDISF